ncbi:hypothetical protein PMZ80_000120 [Knufia obscura]|uniref:Uncharacterized protein n=2 Tax=Knufia TaxID=430999 RepID=A0AAN8EJB9_9EURO|nr:hypothetical protein PMZ80_000120 [Knufia obscura]KAK5956949.1 hypothetical protein OHC33_002438 [Knufia fluminis]
MGLFSKTKKSPNDTSDPDPTKQALTQTTTTDSLSSSSFTTFLKSPSTTTTTNEDKPRKKSFYQKYQDLKRGPGVSSMSDEDLKKYTGKTREELDDWSKTTPGVAGGQAAGSLTAGGTSGIGMAGGAGEGLGGWGFEAGKRPGGRLDGGK